MTSGATRPSAKSGRRRVEAVSLIAPFRSHVYDRIALGLPRLAKILAGGERRS
jgi:hypothetical protein